jgi:hypothetical protein
VLRGEAALAAGAEAEWEQQDVQFVEDRMGDDLEHANAVNGELQELERDRELEEERERAEELQRLAQFDQWVEREEKERARQYALEATDTGSAAPLDAPAPTTAVGGGEVQPGERLGNYFLDYDGDGYAYKQSRIVFLHHNKAGGKSVNTMLAKEARLQRKTVTHASLEMRMTLSDTLLANSDIVYGGYVVDLCSGAALGNGRDCGLITLLRRPIDRMISSFCFCFVDEPDDQLCNKRHLLEEGLSLEVEDIEHFARMTGNLLMEQLTFSRDQGIAASCRGRDDYNCHWKIRLLRAVEQEPDAAFLRSLEWPEMVQEMEEREWEERNESGSDALYEEALSNLRTHFAVVGITEDFDRSAALVKEAFSVTGFEPLHEHQSSDCGIDKELLRKVLVESNATQYFAYDTALYEEALQLFQEQLRASML